MSAAEPLLSQDWYRIAFMRPRLRTGIRVSRQHVRGEIWYVLSDPVSGRHHRFNDLAFRLIGACDGNTAIDEIWAGQLANDGDQASSQGEAIRIFSQAFAANLFVGSVAPDAAAIVRTHSRRHKRRRRAAMNPLAFRVPLWDPDQFLSRHVHRLAILFTRPAQILIALTIVVGALLLALNADEISSYAQRAFSSGRMLLVMWLVYPIIKTLHEFAHAFAIKRHGGEVHEVGITLLMLTPVPYVDASGSIAFSEKHRRMEVAAAGILVEAFLASGALVLWLLMEPGWFHEISFAVVFIGALSTIVVNGNPLLRFDGYYVLCDAAELPNLASRSTRYWQTLVKRRVLRLDHLRFGATARGERPWLVAYAPLSWVYRAVLLSLLVVFAAQWHAALGLLVLALGLWMMLIKPGIAGIRWVLRSGEVQGQRHRAAFAAVVALLLVAALGVGVPVPQRTHAPALVWLPDDAIVRLGSEGFVQEFLAHDGDFVRAGTPIVQIRNDTLRAELARVQSELDQQKIEKGRQFGVNARRAGAAGDQIQQLRAERDRLSERVLQLTVRAKIDGRMVIDSATVSAGQYLPQGEIIGHVLAANAPIVRALVRNEDIGLVRDKPGNIRVRLAHSGNEPYQAAIIGATPKASKSLPTPAMGQRNGGSIALDVSDPKGLTARESRFGFDLKLSGQVDAKIGSRALVTFNHGSTNAVGLVSRRLRQSFLRHLDL